MIALLVETIRLSTKYFVLTRILFILGNNYEERIQCKLETIERTNKLKTLLILKHIKRRDYYTIYLPYDRNIIQNYNHP